MIKINIRKFTLLIITLAIAGLVSLAGAFGLGYAAGTDTRTDSIIKAAESVLYCIDNGATGWTAGRDGVRCIYE